MKGLETVESDFRQSRDHHTDNLSQYALPVEAAESGPERQCSCAPCWAVGLPGGGALWSGTGFFSDRSRGHSARESGTPRAGGGFPS